ncbi:MAG: globin family protein [Pyrinomonadaceae bacterium]|nr:globin family protein [Pyrinomonadaceae bacterium]
MTNEQIELVTKSFEKIAPRADEAAALFYNRLFELDPALMNLFKGDLSEQGLKLIHMIGVAVNGLSRIDDILPAVRSLGARHAVYGVKDAHYETVGSALLWTLAKGLGPDFTEETKEAWNTAYSLLARTMKEAARTAEFAR